MRDKETAQTRNYSNGRCVGERQIVNEWAGITSGEGVPGRRRALESELEDWGVKGGHNSVRQVCDTLEYRTDA